MSSPVAAKGQHVALDDDVQADHRAAAGGRPPAYAAIGKAVGLSEAAVRQRVQRLLEAGVMQIVAVTDPVQVGLLPAGAWSACASTGDVDDGRRPGGRSCARSTTSSSRPGRFDLLVEVVCEDDEHLLDLVSTASGACPGVRTTETFVYLKLRKQRYDWGTR